MGPVEGPASQNSAELYNITGDPTLKVIPRIRRAPIDWLTASAREPVTAIHCESPLVLGSHTFESRLIVGTGKYSTYELMRDCLDASGAEVVTVAVRRERLIDAQGRSILDFIDLSRFTVLPNTAGCFTADDAVRVARLGREILQGLENPGADWVKLEVLGDKRTLLPDTVATLQATEQLVKEG